MLLSATAIRTAVAVALAVIALKSGIAPDAIGLTLGRRAIRACFPRS